MDKIISTFFDIIQQSLLAFVNILTSPAMIAGLQSISATVSQFPPWVLGVLIIIVIRRLF